MSASEAPALDAIAMQLVAALDAYELDTATMIAAWPDLDHYAEVSEKVETIRMYCAALPEVSVPWVELLIAHAELIHHLWRVQYALVKVEGAGDHLATVRERHAVAIVALRNRCLRAVGKPQRQAFGS
jgi:hypothetical protein